MQGTVKTLTAYVVDVPLTTPVVTAHGRFVNQRSAVVRVVTAGGIEGWGEVDPVAGFSTLSADQICAAVNAVSDTFLGIDLEDREAWRAALRTLPAGRQAVEMALLDATARTLGRSLNRLLGTPLRNEIFLSGWIGWEDPQTAAEMAMGWKVRGFQGIKVKIGSSVELDTSRVAAVREAVGEDMRLIVDAGEAYDAEAAGTLLRQLEKFGIAACEQPVPRLDLSALASIRSRTAVPIILDESVNSIADLEQAVAAGAVDIIKLKLVKHDGLESAIALGMAAASHGVQCTVGHGFALGLTTLAEAHIASVLPNFCPLGEMVGPLKMTLDIARPAPDLSSGRLTIPAGPGLGAVVDTDMLLPGSTE